MYLKFWFKNFILKLYPNKYKYYRYMSKLHDSDYIFNRDKHQCRYKHYGKEGWKKEKIDGLLYRDYATYQEYIIHQKQKFEEKLKLKGGFTKDILLSYRFKFYRRFRILSKYLSKSANILCAGARQGTEVEVLHDLGYHNAHGIDLNPGPKNKLVRSGDFMHLENEDSSLDMIYSNSIDHAIDLNAFFKECASVIKSNGYVLYDISSLYKVGQFETVEWETDTIIFNRMLKYFRSLIIVKTEECWKWILLQGKNNPNEDR